MEASRPAWPQHRSLFRRARWLPRGLATSIMMVAAAILLVLSMTSGQ